MTTSRYYEGMTREGLANEARELRAAIDSLTASGAPANDHREALRLLEAEIRSRPPMVGAA